MEDDVPIVQPPATMTVDEPPAKPQPVLYRPDGKPLVRDRAIGFRTIERFKA